MTRIYLGLLVLTFTALAACDDVARSYPTCPPGVTPDEFDCIPPTTVGQDAGAIDLGVGDPDTTIQPDTTTEPDMSTPDLGVCIPDCGDRECGGDGCGGACGTCDRGEACSGGVCIERGGGGGDWDCPEIVDCVQGCRDEGCWEECASQGGPEGRQQFVAIIECLQEECFEFQEDPEAYEQCQNEQCGEQINECFRGDIGPGPGGGDLECSEAVECMFGCDTGECQEECYFEGTTQAQQAMQVLFECPALQDCGGTGSVEGWLDCVRERCPEGFGLCFGGEPIEPTDGCSDEDFRRMESIGEEFGFILVECGFSCSGSPNGDVCAAECSGSAIGVTPECGVCVGGFATCLAGRCGEFCEDPNADDCEECADRFCLEPFYSCAERR